MSPSAENSKLDAFATVAAWYFANPPATWCIARRPSGWVVTAADGTFISKHATIREAAANLTDGPCARDHYDTLDWYLGYSHDPDARPLTKAERDVVAQVLSQIATVPATRISAHDGPIRKNQMRPRCEDNWAIRPNPSTLTCGDTQDVPRGTGGQGGGHTHRSRP
jgi:hypothetical protein